MNYFLLFISLLSFNVNCEYDYFTRTERWTNYKSILTTGWWIQKITLMNRWNSPTDMNSTLANLNSNFTDEVWGWKGRSTVYITNILSFWTRDMPEYCGLVNATMTVKYYFSGNETKNSIYPTMGSSHYLYLKPIPIVEWQSVSVEMDLITGPGGSVRFVVQPGELFLFDEISFLFTFNRSEGICPNYCNHDCQYRAIDCFNYYSCVDRRYKVFHACNANEGLAFNPISKTCDIIENVEGCDLEQNTTRAGDCGYKPHETNCSSYYFCDHNSHQTECEERQCPPGLMWDTDSLNDGTGLQQCILSENAKCRS